MWQINDGYLRPKKAAWLRKMYASPFREKTSLEVLHLENATVLPLRKVPGDDLLFGRGGVADALGNYVPLSGIETRIGLGYPFEDPAYREERVVYCGYLVNHWGHFLVEAVTRLWYALENDATVDKYVFFVNENEQRTVKGNYREFFTLLGIYDKLELVSTPTSFREVIVPEIAFRCMEFYSPKYLEIFDRIAQRITVDPGWMRPDKLYFTRSQFAMGNALEFGLDALDSFFRNNGYLVLAPESVSLSQMIYYIRGASRIATISGSAQHNMLFARSGQVLTIMERLVINCDYQVSINRMRQLDVTPIDANFHLYTIDTAGPYFVGYNHILERYVQDHHLNPPDACYTTAAYRDKCFKQYMASYQDNYRYRWHMESWYPEIADSLYEAYEDNYPCFKEYLDGNKPFLREHYTQWHYFKQWVKRLLRHIPGIPF